MTEGPNRGAKATTTAELCAIADVESLAEFADAYLANIDLDVTLTDFTEVEAWPADYGPGIELVLWFGGGYGTWLPFPLSIDDIVDTAFEKQREVVAVKHSVSPMDRTGSQRLHLGVGAPVDAAIAAITSGYVSENRPWALPDGMRRQDLCLTVLDSDPRLLVVLERVANVHSDHVEVDEAECLTFSDPIPVSALRRILSQPFPTAPATLENDFADEVLSALGELLQTPPRITFTEAAGPTHTCKFRHDGVRAVAIMRSGGHCQGCGRDFGVILDGAGIAALEAHYLTPPMEPPQEDIGTEIAAEDVAAICAGCHKLLHAQSALTLDDLRIAWAQAAHPACPSCGAHRTFHLHYGLTLEPPAPGHYDMGCCVTGDDPEWLCASCGVRWGRFPTGSVAP